jgi:serine/threonine protein phosphatase PrpC
MGTTVVVVFYHGDKVSIAHVGDSRVYRLRGNEFKQITRDHSLIQELIDRGFFTPEEAAENTPKNLVTRALGHRAVGRGGRAGAGPPGGRDLPALFGRPQ